ncbi:MAG: bifunctional protein-serine/threonine kinase/phosphatase [Xanthobacteraceae bacterium]
MANTPNTPASDRAAALVTQSGFCSERGERAGNEDYVGVADGKGSPAGMVAVIADGVGGSKGGRIAAELAVRGFIEGYLGRGRHEGPRDASVRSLEAVNRWVHAMGRRDPDLQGMACTFTALVCEGRELHVVHVGDSRLYRLRGSQLQQLTVDHALGAGQLGVLTRAVGADDEVRIDYVKLPNEPHDRYLLCTDGVHGGVADEVLREILIRRATPDETAREIVDRAIAAHIGDNATALVVDVIALPSSAFSDVESAVLGKVISALPAAGEVIDDFRIDAVLSESRYVKVYLATDLRDGRKTVLKFPKPLEGADRPMREAFLRETWIASRIRSPYVGEVLQLASGRQSRLYLAMPFYDGELLESRLKRKPALTLTAGLDIALKLARGVVAMHRAGIIHRDIKPDNVILSPQVAGQPTALKIIDFGVARLKSNGEIGVVAEPGTPSFMAPELFNGSQAGEASDQFALGVTIYRLFTGRYPYGEIEPFTNPKFRKPTPIASYRPDLPAWLDKVIGRALAVSPDERFGDVIELIFELEHGADRASPIHLERKPFYARNPLLFWKLTSAALALGWAATLFWALHKAPADRAPIRARPVIQQVR